VPFLQAANYLTIMDAAKEKPVAYKEDLGGE
jgi:hypothetical protein